MMSIIIENIIAHAQISQSLDIENLVDKIPDFKYNPDEFSGATLKLEYPKTAVLILPSGKIICTGAKNIEEVETSIRKITNKMSEVGINVVTNPKVETQNIIVSTDLQKELNLNSISKSLLLEHVNFNPEHFPGLIYNMDGSGVLLLIFSSGKIICTGAKNLEDASNAIQKMKEKLSSFGAV
jgi:transcription initiation factor TFIID TATA-box-binding protein